MVCGSLFVAALAPAVADVVGYELTPAMLALGVAVAPIPALLPDIDHPDALLTRGWIPFGRKFGPLWKLVGHLLAIPPRVVGMLSRSVMGHRGGTHSLAFNALWAIGAVPLYGLFFFVLAYLISLVVSALYPPLAFDPAGLGVWMIEHFPAAMPFTMLVVGIAYFSHLFVDCLNGNLKVASGVPWFWPVWNKKINFLPGPLAIFRVPVRTPEMHRKEWAFQKMALLLTVAAVFLNVGSPILMRVQEGYSVVDAATKSQRELAAMPPAAR